jgi:sugar lactone lactonase YvrE
VALEPDGSRQVMARTPSFPFCIDWLPDGRLLILLAREGLLLRQESDGTLVTHAELQELSERPWNDIVVDECGNAYVNNLGFDFPFGEFAPGSLAVVAPDGDARPWPMVWPSRTAWCYPRTDRRSLSLSPMAIA